MNIQTVADNLRNTIAGKEAYLATLTSRRIPPEAVIHFLEINIRELKVILFDVEKCCEKATHDSWAANPDRMGGQFTEDEKNDTGWH